MRFRLRDDSWVRNFERTHFYLMRLSYEKQNIWYWASFNFYWYFLQKKKSINKLTYCSSFFSFFFVSILENKNCPDVMLQTLSLLLFIFFAMCRLTVLNVDAIKLLFLLNEIFNSRTIPVGGEWNKMCVAIHFMRETLAIF